MTSHALELTSDWVPLPTSPAEAQSVRSAPSVCGDLPPPASAPTLLNLHCALNA